MEIQARLTGRRSQVVVSRVTSDDLKTLTKKRYFFSWSSLKPEAELFKLAIQGTKDILGVIALIDFELEKRIEIKLLASSRENVGKDKVYENIAGCMIAYTCGKALTKYGIYACVSMLPKTKLKQHYISKYNMWDGGKHVFLEGSNLNDIIKKYFI